MKVSNFNELYNKLIIDFLKNLELSDVKTETTGKHAKSNTTTPDFPVRVDKISIPTDIKNILKGLDPLLQEKLIKYWINHKLPLDIKLLTTFIKLIKKTRPGANLNTMVKSFALLVKNKLPLASELFKGLILSYNSRESNSSESYVFQMGGLRDQLPRKLTREFLFYHHDSPTRIEAKLSNYTEKLNELLQTLENLKENNSQYKKLFNQITGNKLINLTSNENLLLSLELPLTFPDQNRPLPLYCQIWNQPRSKKGGNQNGKNKSYQIVFLIELPRKGLIKAQIIYKSGHIKSSFQTGSNRTAELIKQNLPQLITRLEENGFSIDPPVVETIKEHRFDSGYKKSGTKSITENFRGHFDLRI
ncbi:flagellar hook-length control protein FliK [Halothermothrix orenii]|uniref:Flagellar hook-length control protein-like C-terminal domain-containing protein n=1 Tax=Halothermothrix orenii (strain H 168 / OCM 544 / DSM 9562) TaxID=373903 RepID=B8CZM0_HALOH|nr:flagellar hook-length control protein FliK [Halothermothrix orenii]ACL70739.1 hypothetical protein Hore_19920 [Halothermothrix orenii H 168]